MLVFAYLWRVIINPVISILEQWTGSRKWSVVIVMVLLIICLVILSSSLFPLIGNQIIAFQSALSMETLTKFLAKLTVVLESILPVLIFNLFNDVMGQLYSTFSENFLAEMNRLTFAKYFKTV